jgi:hypothetical protein
VQGGPEFGAMADVLLRFGAQGERVGERVGEREREGSALLNCGGTASGEPPLLLAVSDWLCE